MTGADRLKEALPFPFSEDLAPVLVNLNRRTEKGRRRLANDPVTAAYLAAALRLVEQRIGVGAGAGVRAADRPQFAFLSQRAVANEVAHNPDPFPRRGSVSTMRASWRSQSDFLADLLNFALWTGYYPVSHAEMVQSGVKALTTGADHAEAMRDLAFRATDEAIGMLTFRIQLFAAVSTQDDVALRDVLAAKYRRGSSVWAKVFTEMMAARRLRLRPGITVHEFADILTAVVEGSAIRAMADPDPVLSADTGRSLVGTAALAIIRGAMEPWGAEDGLDLAGAVNAMTVEHARQP